MPIERIQPDGLRPPPGYTHVVRAGNLVFVAGQTAVDVSGNVVGVGDFEAQADQVYDNVRIALASVGADFSNIVKATIYLTRAQDMDGYRRARAKYFPDQFPASTLLFISGLANPDFLLEIDVVAALD